MKNLTTINNLTKLARVTGLVFLVVVAMAYTAQATPLAISPANATWFGNVSPPSNGNVIAAANTACGGCLTTLQYTDDPGAADSGPLASSYSTVFSNTSTDPADFVLTYGSGSAVSGGYLLIKDGNHTPTYYLFNLTASGLNWDGVGTITGTAFWPQQGAISHISIYGGSGGGVTPSAVPEPTSLLLIGAGLAGLGFFRRKF